MISIALLLPRAERYAKARGTKLLSQDPMDFGTDGAVWETKRDTVIKLIQKPMVYANERDCYLRFRDRSVTKIAGFAVPVLGDFDDELQAIEMTIVHPPRILDFGKVAIDFPPPYYDDARVMGNELARCRDLFGKDWPEIAYVIQLLRDDFGIYYADPSPANICKKNPDPADDLWQPSPEFDMDIYDE